MVSGISGYSIQVEYAKVVPSITVEGLQPICDVANDESISCADGIFVEASQEEIIKEASSVEEKLCPYCSKESRELLIEVDSTSYSDQSFKVEGGFLQSDEWKLSINYCPMCGKKLK